MDERNQVRHPDAGAQSFAGDVADDDAQGRTQLKNLEEIARKMAHRENLSRDFEFRCLELARRAEPALNLSGFKKAALDQGLIAAHRAQFLFECADPFVIFARAERLR